MERCKELGALVGQRWRHSAVLARSMLWLRHKEAGDATKVRRALVFWTAPAGHARLLRILCLGKCAGMKGFGQVISVGAARCMQLPKAMLLVVISGKEMVNECDGVDMRRRKNKWQLAVMVAANG